MSVPPVGHPAVEALRIELEPGSRGPNRLGRLTFLGGFELKSSDPRLGGLSGLALSPDGRSLYAVSDRGYWLSALIRHDGEGRLTDLGSWEIGPLLTPEGVPVSGRLRDAEALTRDRGGSFIVSFEQLHRLWSYPPPPAAFSSPAQPLPTPAELAKAPSNGGAEGVAALPDGRLLVITEEHENPDGSLKGWLIEKDRFASISYLPSEGFRPTDLAVMTGGDVLALERHYSVTNGWAVRVKWLSREKLRAGALLSGREMGRLEPPSIVDNFEGIAVREDPEAGTLVYLISDDNYSSLQRTLLLQFRLETAGRN